VVTHRELFTWTHRQAMQRALAQPPEPGHKERGLDRGGRYGHPPGEDDAKVDAWVGWMVGGLTSCSLFGTVCSANSTASQHTVRT